MNIEFKFVNKKRTFDYYFFVLTWWFFGLSLMLFFFHLYILLIPLIHLLDLILWRSRGIEIIIFEDEELVIQKKRRLFNREKRVSKKDINRIYSWNKKVWYIDILESLAAWDYAYQGALCVKYNNKKYYFGRFLSENETTELLNDINGELGLN